MIDRKNIYENFNHEREHSCQQNFRPIYEPYIQGQESSATAVCSTNDYNNKKNTRLEIDTPK